MTELTQKQSRDACCRLIRGCVRFIERGYGKARLWSFIGGPGCLRIYLMADGGMGEALFRYSSASGFRFMEDHRRERLPWNAGPDRIADAIERAADPRLIESCRGPVPAEYSDWLHAVLRNVGADLIPVECVDGYSRRDGRWWLNAAGSGLGASMPAPRDFRLPGERTFRLD